MWDTRYRPLRFDDVLGQVGTIQVLKARLAKGTALDRSYIFAGGFGQGKTTLARILARAILCQNRDPATQEPCNECPNCRDILEGNSMAYVEQDAASGGTIDRIRSIVEELPYAVFGASKRLYTFDEAHRMSKDAQDVLLKPLEEGQMVGIFCTTELDKIRGAIRSRCDEFTLRKVTREDILERMRKVLTLEGVAFEDEAVLIVIDQSGGHVRDVLNRLEMIAQMGDVTADNVRTYLHLSVVTLYYRILLALGTPQEALVLVEEACTQASPEDVSAGLAEAAMTSYRLANGLYTEFTYVDQNLARRVYAQYQEATVSLARWFLRGRSQTKIGLLCDVLSCSKLQKDPSSVLVSEGMPDATPPIQITTPSTPIPTPSSTPTLTIGPSVPQTPTPSSITATSSPQSPKPKETQYAGPVGNLGSDDPRALTAVDTHGVPSTHPRRSTVHKTVVLEEPSTAEVLTVNEWRRKFEVWWKRQYS